jgi:hypothetical protein
MAEPSRALQQHQDRSPDRRLRNRIIVGNAMIWIVILVLIRLIFF